MISLHLFCVGFMVLAASAVSEHRNLQPPGNGREKRHLTSSLAPHSSGSHAAESDAPPAGGAATTDPPGVSQAEAVPQSQAQALRVVDLALFKDPPKYNAYMKASKLESVPSFKWAIRNPNLEGNLTPKQLKKYIRRCKKAKVHDNLAADYSKRAHDASFAIVGIPGHF